MESGERMERRQFLIVGVSLAAESAVHAIRETGKTGSVLLVSEEATPPYEQPPLLSEGTRPDEKSFKIYRQMVCIMLDILLHHLIHQGTLTIIFPNNSRRSYGRGDPQVVVRLHDRRAAIELAMRPEMKLGELYMDRRITVEEGGDIAGLLDLLMTNLNQLRRSSIVLRLRCALGFDLAPST